MAPVTIPATMVLPNVQRSAYVNYVKNKTLLPTPLTPAVSSTTVYFAFDRATLSAAAQRQLIQFIDRAEGYPGSVRRYRISGFASTPGSHDYNQALSVKRAKAVANFLNTHKLAVCSVKGYGEVVTQPYHKAQKVVVKVSVC